MADTYSEKLKTELERIKLHNGAKMECTKGEVSVEREESNEMASYFYDNANDFAEGIMFVLDLIQNGYMKAR